MEIDPELIEPVYGAFDTEAPAMQIKATAGIGKTQTVIEELAESDDWRSREVHYFAPDHAQAAEVAELRWVGVGPKFIKIGAAVRYHPEQLKDYLAKQVRSSTSDPGAYEVQS